MGRASLLPSPPRPPMLARIPPAGPGLLVALPLCSRLAALAWSIRKAGCASGREASLGNPWVGCLLGGCVKVQSVTTIMNLLHQTLPLLSVPGRPNMN